MSEKKQNKAMQVATSEAVDERVYTLSRPFSFEGKEYTELVLDFDSLSGGDLSSLLRKPAKDGDGCKRIYPHERNI
ncbi:hypothetical protein P7H21_26260 [Paenibacillus larvae]|nr:hypothetical protein [Paenibacillus larvae]MDT2306749.1 hypothetical protein [Paenibacillus larvae]